MKYYITLLQYVRYNSATMKNRYLAPAEAEDLWANLYKSDAEQRCADESVSFPGESDKGSIRSLPPGHLAIHPDAALIIENQQKALSITKAPTHL